MTANVRQEFAAVFKGLQLGLPRIGYLRDEDGTVIAAVLAVVELAPDGSVRSHTPVAELFLPVVGMPLAA